MTKTLAVALLTALAVLPAGAQEIELDPQCRLSAKLVNKAIESNSTAGLNEVGLACFCKYNTAANSACGKSRAAAAPKETDPVKLCAQNKAAYEGSASDREDLVSNPQNFTASKPPRGWAGNEYQGWVDSNRSIGMLKLSALREQLQQLNDFEALNKEYVRSCTAALDFANGSFKPKMLTLSPLGGRAFEDNWASKKNELAADLRRIQTAVANLSAVVN